MQFICIVPIPHFLTYGAIYIASIVTIGTDLFAYVLCDDNRHHSFPASFFVRIPKQLESQQRLKNL